MRMVQLKNLYHYLNEEIELLVSNEIYNVFEEFRRAEKAYLARLKYHKAYYSLDCNDGIESFCVHKSKSPDAILATREIKEYLIRILNELPDKQAKRIYMYFYMDMTLKEIAKKESVSIAAINQSIILGLRTMRKYIENSSFVEECYINK